MNNKTASRLHGIIFIMGLAFAAFYIAEFQCVKALSLSPLIVGILIGIVYANTLRPYLPADWTPGIKLCTKQVLRTGIVLYGFRLTIQDVISVGVPALTVDCIIVVCTIFIAIMLGKWLKIDSDTALLTGTGSAICGAAAVLGAEPVVRPSDAGKTAVAVSTVVIFGTLSMFLYPTLQRLGVLDDMSLTQVAVYTGSTLHEVAHVVGAGNAMDADGSLGIASTATIVKMIRVILLAPVLLVMSLCISRGAKGGKRSITIPWFAFGFMGMICLASLLEATIGDISQIVQPVNSISTFLLTMAMTALGTDTSWDKFRQAGARPFLLAGLLYVWLLLGGYALCKWIV